MTKVKIFVVLGAVFFSFLNVNTSDGEKSKSPPKPVNIIVILDTSDRVSKKKHSDQVERDKKIVKEIITQFNEVVKEHIEKGDELKYDSRLDIVIPNQPSVPMIPWDITEKLTIKDRKGKDKRGHTSIAGIHDDLEKQGKALLDAMSELYDFVGEHNQTGSDIWEWFRSEAKDYLSADHQNLIICISDGYLDFDKKIEAKRTKGTYMQVGKLRDDPDWKQKIHNSDGLLPIGQDFNHYNVKFLMLEIALRSEKATGVPYQKDFDIIREYWKTWLKLMRIESTNFIKRGSHPGRQIESYFKSSHC